MTYFLCRRRVRPRRRTGRRVSTTPSSDARYLRCLCNGLGGRRYALACHWGRLLASGTVCEVLLCISDRGSNIRPVAFVYGSWGSRTTSSSCTATASHAKAPCEGARRGGLRWSRRTHRECTRLRRLRWIGSQMMRMRTRAFRYRTILEMSTSILPQSNPFVTRCAARWHPEVVIRKLCFGRLAKGNIKDPDSLGYGGVGVFSASP